MTTAEERVTRFLEGVDRRRRRIVTPEGVALSVELADLGERATAFAIDMFIWLCATVFLFLVLALLILHGMRPIIALSLILFIAFLVRNLYFVHFELTWQGATPGKRIVGLRVVDRRGGPLLPSSVIARNLTREVEIFLPLGLLLSLGAGTAAWERLCLAGWFLTLTALPLFNHDRLRGGDLIAGTMVIALPRRVLLPEIVEPSAHYAFAEAHLGRYGAFELQILEELLRRPESAASARLRREVCDKICRRIAWPTPVPEADALLFLREFYTAERAFLEREQLFGRPHADKHFGEGKTSPR
jgi:uncharacterized RDD family membrane protein YckC